MSPVKLRLFRRIAGWTLFITFVLSLTVSTYTYGLVKYIDDNPAQILTGLTGNTSTTSDDPKPWTLVNSKGEIPSDIGNLKYNKNLYVVLFIGADTTDTRSKSYGYRSDVLMLLCTDLVTHKSYMISIPRDTGATVNKLNDKGEIIGTTFAKINASFAYGRGAAHFGCQNAMAAVSKLIDIPINDYVCFDIDAIPPLADAVNGVRLKITGDFSKYGMPMGSYQVLDGKKAAIYCRERKHVGTGGSDIARTGRQLQFVNAYIQKAQTLNPVALFTKNYPLIKKLVHTNLSYEKMYSLAKVIPSARFDTAVKYTLPGKSDSEYHWILNQTELNRIRTEVFFVPK